jgi:predicted ATPase
LSRAPTLLLLDNCEHLLAEAARLVQILLERIPTLTCLVTSRQPLALAGEREFPVFPLPVPPAPAAPCALIEYAGVRLFLDRAQGVRPDFQVTRTNAAALAALVRRLEGLPLAIELAAARARVLTPAQMLARLEGRFDLLVSRQRGVTPRHRSLRATLDWSSALLPEELQRFFARLSVFRGDWAAEAAETVCAQEGTLDRLEQLRECSLVIAEEAGDQTRFRMLETVREYADERLDGEERRAAQARHASYFLALAEQKRSSRPSTDPTDPLGSSSCTMSVRISGPRWPGA